MKFNLKLIVFTSILSLLISLNTYNQEVRGDIEVLDFNDSGKAIENTINLYTSGLNYKTIKAAVGTKTIVKATGLIINGDSVAPGKINTRGQTTLQYRRKSYSFNLGSKASFHHGDKTESFRKFYTLSLSMDRDYMSNRLAYEMMETLKLFRLFYAYCEMKINGQTEGIYMIVERPEDWASRKKESPIVIRRGYNEQIDKIITDKKTGKSEVKSWCSNYYQIYRNINRYKGEELYDTLSRHLDLDNYMKWLAFNFLVRNGDYTDEVYLYADRASGRFSIIPWDYDDLFRTAPHEGEAAKSTIHEGNLIFSTEDELDKRIASDPYLYGKYLEQLRDVLNRLSPLVLKQVFENTYCELYPYYQKSEILKMSGFDVYKDATLERLQSDMVILFTQLKRYRNGFLNYLDSRQ